jgi:mannitol-1-/sugar-/sorbitol-6-phosphatase
MVGRSVILRCEALLFDLDGVLVDSAACVEATWRRWAVTHDLDPNAVIAEAHGRRSIETIRRFAPHLAVQDEVAALAASEATTTEGVYEVPGARSLLEHLPLHHWAIVTSGIHAVAALRIGHTHLPTPAVLVCADEISRGKPDPEGYLTAARRLGIEPADCIVVEDAPAGLEAAGAAGMRSIGIAGTYAPAALQAAMVRVAALDALEVVSGPRTLPIELRVRPTA